MTLLVVLVALLVTGSVSAEGFVACPRPPDVTLCHASPPATAAQGWHEITVAAPAVLQQGHDNHGADIIPAFQWYEYEKVGERIQHKHHSWITGRWSSWSNGTCHFEWWADGCQERTIPIMGDVLHTYPGKNMATEFAPGITGAEILRNGCVLPWTPPDPQAREYNTCDGVFSQNQEWVGGPDGGYEDVGDPVLLHAWSDPFDYEVWGDWAEPTECHNFNIKKIERSDCDGYYRKVNLRDGDTWIKSLYVDQGPWSDPFITETLPAYTFPVPDVYGEDVVFDELSEPSDCLEYDWGLGYIDGGCAFDYVAPYVSGDGWIVTDMPGNGGSHTFSWTDPYALETYPAGATPTNTIRYHITFHWPNGHVEDPYPNGFYFYEPPECLRHLTSVDVVKVSCDYRKGTEYAFFLGEGIQQVEIDGQVLTESGSIYLMPGNYHWVATLKESYDAEGPLEGDLDVKGCEPDLKCPECGEHVDESNVGIYGPGLAIAWTGTDECVVDLQNWCIILPNTVRAWSLDYFEFTDQPETEVRNGVDGNTWYVVNGADPAGEWRILNADGQPYRNYGVEDNPVYKFSACSVDVGPWDTHDGKGIIAYGQNPSDWASYLIEGGSCYPNTYVGYGEAFEYLKSVGIDSLISWTLIGESFDLPDSCSW